MSATLKLRKPAGIKMYEEFPALHTYLTSAKNDSCIREDSEGDISRSTYSVSIVSQSDTPSSPNVIPIFNR
jgi:hypothetical protein